MIELGLVIIVSTAPGWIYSIFLKDNLDHWKHRALEAERYISDPEHNQHPRIWADSPMKDHG